MARSVIEPPTLDPVLNADVHSHAWTDYHNKSAALLSDVVDRLLSITKGVVDGSEADAGEVGEVRTATTAGTALSNSVFANAASITLPPGDWDVNGFVTFNITAAASNHYGVGLDTLSHEIIATIPTGTGTWRLNAMQIRKNVAVDTVVNLVCVAVFGSGAISADGFISARRAR